MARFTAPLALLALATQIVAQTSTSCNPLNTTCPRDPALGTTFSTVFDSSMTQFNPQLFNVVASEDLITFSDEGAELAIAKQGPESLSPPGLLEPEHGHKGYS